MDVDALGRDARLAGVAEAGDRDQSGGAVPVAVGFDDHRRVVAELERHLLARRLLGDAPPDLGRAGEADVGHVVVGHQRVAHTAARAGDDVEVAGRQAALVEQQVGKRQGRERRLRRGFEDNRAAGGDGGRQLVGDQVEREVER